MSFIITEDNDFLTTEDDLFLVTEDEVPPIAYAAFRAIFPHIPSFMFGGGTIVPVAPLSTTAVRAKGITSQLDIHRQISQIRNKGDQNLASALTNLQDHANTSDQRLRDVSGSLNSLGLAKDPGGNILIKSTTFTVALPLQTFAITNRSVVQSAPPAAPPDSILSPSSLTMWFDELTNTLTIRIRKSDGTYVTKTL